MSWACFAVGTFAVVKVCIINLYHKYTHTHLYYSFTFFYWIINTITQDFNSSRIGTSTLISSFRIIFQGLSFISEYRATSCKIEQELKVNKKLSLFLIFSLLAFSLKNIIIFPQVQYKILDREKFFPSDRAAGNREGKYSTLRYNMINCAENLLSRHQSTTDFGFV